MVNMEEFYKQMEAKTEVIEGSKLFDTFNYLSQEAIKITMEINTKYNKPSRIVKLMSKLTGKKIDKSFRLFPPFYTDCGKNITFGKNVFVNSGCNFQDQGGIFIGDGVLIGHNVTFATLNHNENPQKRQNIIPKPIKVGNNVWIGSNVTILPGVTIGSGAIIGAGSVVTKDIKENSVAFGVSAKVIREVRR